MRLSASLEFAAAREDMAAQRETVSDAPATARRMDAAAFQVFYAKTAPGLRLIDKHAVRCGGGQNHRLDLSDGVLIKANHIALAGGIISALERAIRNRRGRQPIEIEVRSLEELQQALESGAEAILLDNVSIEKVRKAVEICSRQPRRIPLECAGGINLENVRSYAETGVDFISVGALTQSATAVDMSLRVTPA